MSGHSEMIRLSVVVRRLSSRAIFLVQRIQNLVDEERAKRKKFDSVPRFPGI
jgi:hypothetical protein